LSVCRQTIINPVRSWPTVGRRENTPTEIKRSVAFAPEHRFKPTEKRHDNRMSPSTLTLEARKNHGSRVVEDSRLPLLGNCDHSPVLGDLFLHKASNNAPKTSLN